MGLFSLPPAQSRADLNLDMFLGGNDGGKVQKKMRRVMPAALRAWCHAWPMHRTGRPCQ